MNVPLPATDRDAALAFLWNRIDYERAADVPYHTTGFKLERMRELLCRLGNPQAQLRIVHIAGTKGKGSTAAMIAAVLTAAGYRTGLFSSPHLDRVEERLAIDGEPCSAAEFVQIVDAARPAIAAMDDEAAALSPPETGPTYFEITTALGLLHYARRGVHTAVLEVGLGGRLDSTNVVDPDVVVITSISYDHMQQLGNTLAKIAGEKAGIIKPGVPVVSGVLPPEAQEVIEGTCRERGCRLLQIGRDFSAAYRAPLDLQRQSSPAAIDFFQSQHSADVPVYRDLEIPLLGQHQAANGAVALAAIGQLREQGWQVPEAAIRAGLAALQWPARVEIVHRHPTVVLDVAHNVASIEALLQALADSFRVRRRYLIFATTKDKDIRGMLRHLLPAFDHVILTRYHNNPRGESLEQIRHLAADVGAGSFETTADTAAAWSRVQQLAQADDLICVAGSFFLAAEFRELLRRNESPWQAWTKPHNGVSSLTVPIPECAPR